MVVLKIHVRFSGKNVHRTYSRKYVLLQWPLFFQEFSTWNGVQPVSRDFHPVWGENPFVKFLISLKSTEILYPTLVKFS